MPMISRRSLFKGLAGLAALPLVAKIAEADDKYVAEPADLNDWLNNDYFNEFNVVRGMDGRIVDVVYRGRRT